MQHLRIYESAGRDHSYMQLIPMTPATSFSMTGGQGSKHERALIYAVLRRYPVFESYQDPLKQLLQYEHTLQWWDWNIDEYNKRIDECDAETGNYLSDMMDAISRYFKLEPAFLDEVLDICKQPEVMELPHRRRREAVNGLRRMFASISLDRLKPDLVIMDEFQILFDSGTNRKVAERCANLAKKIVTEGRSYGVHLLMATQSTKIISTLTLDRGTIEQMRIRVGLKCGEDDTRYLFGDTHCSDAMKKMEGPRGTAVLNEDYTENNPNVGLRVAFCNDETKKYYLKQISEKFADSPCTMQVFEGSRTVPMLDYLAARSIGIADTSTVTVHMGEKIKVDDPFELTFDRKKQHNVLICGSNDELMDRTVNLFLLSAALNRRACVYCVDGDSIVGDDRCGSFYQSLEHGVAELHTAHTRSDIVQFVHDLYEKYQQRKKKTGGDTVLFVIKNLQFLDLMQTMLLGDRVDEAEYIEFLAEPKAVDVPPTVVEDPTLDLLAGFSAEPTDSPVEPTGFSTKPADDDPFAALLAQVPSLTADVAPAESQNVEERDPFADLMASFSSIGADSSHVSAQPVSGAMGNASEKLQKLIADGAAYGIHFIICSSDYQTVKESMHFGMNILNKFRERIVFALSDSDAFNLIDNVNVSTLHDNTVYYTNGATDTFQFKPYVSPAPEQVETFCSELLPM